MKLGYAVDPVRKIGKKADAIKKKLLLTFGKTLHELSGHQSPEISRAE